MDSDSIQLHLDVSLSRTTYNRDGGKYDYSMLSVLM